MTHKVIVKNVISDVILVKILIKNVQNVRLVKEDPWYYHSVFVIMGIINLIKII